MSRKKSKSSCPPPPRHRSAENVTWSQLSYRPGFLAGKRRSKSGARLAGLAYEKRVREYLTEEFADYIVPGPWIQFRCEDDEAVRWCQPDILLVDIRRARITIIEIKIRHTSDAWWQLRQLYQPVVRHLFGPTWRYSAVEIAKWFDPATHFPERFTFVDEVDALASLPSEKFHVHLWNGKLT